MAKVIAGTTMSLDGFMSDAQGDLGPLYPDFEALHRSEMLKEEIRNTGAVLMGRVAYDMAGGDFTGYEYQVPIFVLTHHPPETPPRGQNERLTVTFVTQSAVRAVEEAKAAAGEKVVMCVGGASTAQQLLAAGLVDELHFGIMPVMLGEGLRFFAPGTDVPLEKIRVFDEGPRTDIWFRVVKEG